MVDWNSPLTQLQLYASFSKLLQVLVGAYLWEIVTSLPFDIRLFRDSKGSSSAWSKWIYLSCRYITLIYSVLNLVITNLQHQVNCKGWAKGVFLTSYVTVTFASSLIGLRVIAIWNKDRRLIAIVILCLLTQLAFSLHNLVEVTAVWSPEINACVFPNVNTAAANILAILICDSALLACMFAGLLRKRYTRGHGIWHVLWTQGLVWAALAIFAEVPSVAVIFLDLTSVLDLLAAIPAFFVLSVCATRLYRSLYNTVRYPTSTTRTISSSRGLLWRQRNNRQVFTTRINVHHLTEFK